MVTGSPRLGLPDNMKNGIYHSITSLSAMQTPSGVKISSSPQIRIDNVFTAVFEFIALEN